ncbi:MAG: hypothetical protein ACKPKO_04570, partial [Candidatus Fonsibacter sp.]
QKQMIHHRLAHYNPVVWIGRKQLTGPGGDINGDYIFVFQPEKRQEEARRICQSEQTAWGARTKHYGPSHRDFIVGKLVDSNKAKLDALLQRILLED